MTVYQSGEDAERDCEFELGELAHLVVGNRGRLRDDRRTPIVLTGVDAGAGMFELEIAAFEDRGARWRLPFEDVGKFQFERGASRVDDAGLAAAVARFDRPLHVNCDPAARERTVAQIAELASHAVRFLQSRWSGSLALDIPSGDPQLFDASEAWMKQRELGDIEREFARVFVSNPHSGELVKGHAIVAAELGLCPYTGKIVRSPLLFAGPWSRPRRAGHLVSRLALVRAIFTIAGLENVVLYRGLASDAPIEPVRSRSFVSTTFCPRGGRSALPGRGHHRRSRPVPTAGTGESAIDDPLRNSSDERPVPRGRSNPARRPDQSALLIHPNWPTACTPKRHVTPRPHRRAAR